MWVILHTLISLQSVQFKFSLSVVSDSLRPHESQHARPLCPSPAPGVHSNSRPSNWWCHPAISSSVIPFSSCPQSLPASESFPMSQFFVWVGQSTGVSALASLLPKNTQDWSLRMDWLDLPAVQGTLKSLLQHHSSKASILTYFSLKAFQSIKNTITLLSYFPPKGTEAKRADGLLGNLTVIEHLLCARSWRGRERLAADPRVWGFDQALWFLRFVEK